jgi:hypothetical protein
VQDHANFPLMTIEYVSYNEKQVLNLNLGKEYSVQNLQSCFWGSFPDLRWFAVE